MSGSSTVPGAPSPRSRSSPERSCRLGGGEVGNLIEIGRECRVEGETIGAEPPRQDVIVVAARQEIGLGTASEMIGAILAEDLARLAAIAIVDVVAATESDLTWMVPWLMITSCTSALSTMSLIILPALLSENRPVAA